MDLVGNLELPHLFYPVILDGWTPELEMLGGDLDEHSVDFRKIVENMVQRRIENRKIPKFRILLAWSL